MYQTTIMYLLTLTPWESNIILYKKGDLSTFHAIIMTKIKTGINQCEAYGIEGERHMTIII